LEEKITGYRKKKRFKKHKQSNNYVVDDVLRGVGFKVGKEGTELYAKTIERLGLHKYTI